jgi:hypothetical protein
VTGPQPGCIHPCQDAFGDTQGFAAVADVVGMSEAFHCPTSRSGPEYGQRIAAAERKDEMTWPFAVGDSAPKLEDHES